MKFFQKIGLFFVGLFNAAQRAYNQLSADQQNALIHGSGIIAIINSMTTAAANEVKDAIIQRFPDLDIDRLHKGLYEVARSFGLDVKEDDSLEDLIAKLQSHFSFLQGKTWAAASHFAASLFAIVVAPPETKFAAISSLLEWVYQHYIKKAIPSESKE